MSIHTTTTVVDPEADLSLDRRFFTHEDMDEYALATGALNAVALIAA